MLVVCSFSVVVPAFGHAQERRKIRISNATLSYSALPLVAAREWKLFQKQGLDVEIILMRSAAAVAALVSGDLDYQSGIGSASVSATLSGVDSRALWSSTSHITYWLMAKPEYKSVQDLKRQEDRRFRFGGNEPRGDGGRAGKTRYDGAQECVRFTLADCAGRFSIRSTA